MGYDDNDDNDNGRNLVGKDIHKVLLASFLFETSRLEREKIEMVLHLILCSCRSV